MEKNDIDGFIGEVEIAWNSKDRMVKLTHIVKDGVAEPIGEEKNWNLYLSWIKSKRVRIDEERVNSITIHQFSHFAESGHDKTSVYIDKGINLKCSKIGNYYFTVTLNSSNKIYVEKGSYDREWDRLVNLVKDTKICKYLNECSLTEKLISMGNDTDENDKICFVKLVDLTSQNMELYKLYKSRTAFRVYDDKEQAQNAFRAFLPDVCFSTFPNDKQLENDINEEVLSLNSGEIEGFLGRVLSGNTIKLERYLCGGEIIHYGARDERIEEYYGEGRLPSQLYYDGALRVEPNDEVYIPCMKELKKVCNESMGYIKYFLLSTDDIYVARDLSNQIVDKQYILHEETESVFKVDKADAYGRVRLVPCGCIYIEGKPYITEDADDRAYTYEETRSIYKLFDYYYPNAKKLADADEDERAILEESIRCFMPEGCNTEELLQKINSRNKITELLGIDYVESEDIDYKKNRFVEMEKIYAGKNYSKHSLLESRSNELTNLIIALAQGFVTVITGRPGNAKGALCDKLGEALALTNFTTEAGKDISRYQKLHSSKTWTDKNIFEKMFLAEGAIYHEAMSLLDYEAKNKEASTTLPYIFAIKSATDAPIDDYFEDFLTICKNWYREDIQYIGDSTMQLSKNMRFLMTANNNENIFSNDFVASANFINIEDAIGLIDELQKVEGDDLGILYERAKANTFSPAITIIEKWARLGHNTKECNDIFNQLLRLVNDNVLRDGSKLVLEDNRLSHAVSRQWYIASDYMVNEDNFADMKPEEIYAELVERYVPDGVVIDEECIDYENTMIPNEIVALDYAIAQRVLPCITRVKGETKINNITSIVEFLLKNKLYKCAAELKDAIDLNMVRIANELSDAENDRYIVGKCKQIYKDMLKNAYSIDSTGVALDEYVCDLVNRFRHRDVYTHNVVTNMLICMTQGFLTVFSGKPGCGKTSICKILGECLGLTNYNNESDMIVSGASYEDFKDRRNEWVNPSRFLEVSTERGWTSKRDFIGYYNPLTEQFDKSNAVLYNAFLVMNNERYNKDLEWPPCFVLLDEANLSPMEYYWADFMNLCENWKPSYSIDLGGGREFSIPETLHFMATINNDHTTELLSPRLIDRANVIDLPEASYKRPDETELLEIKPVSWLQLKNMFGCNEKDAEISEDYNALYKKIKTYVESRFKVSISPRTDIAVSRYWTVASRAFSEETYGIKQKLLEELTGKIDNSSEQDVFDYIINSVLQLGEAEKKLGSVELPEDYEEVVASREIQALDYAVAQRVLPKIIDECGENVFASLVGLYVMLIENRMYKSAGIVVDIIQRGYETGFYNYFR